MRVAWAVALLSALAIRAGTPSARQAQTDARPSFRASTDLVRVYATVRDKAGHLVTDLRAEEFGVRERGERVPLAFFSTEAQPIRVVVMVDMSGSIFDHPTFQQIRDGLSAFVDQLGAGDRGALGWFSHEHIAVASALTPDTAKLKRQIDAEIQIQHVHPRLASLGLHEGAFGRDFATGRPLWNAIGAAAGVLAREPGRKVVLVLANGNDTKNLTGYPRLNDLKAAMAGDELMVYAIHGFEPRMADPSPRRADEITGSSEERQTTLRHITELTGGGFLTVPFDMRKRRTLGMEGMNAARNPLSLAFRSQLAGIVDELRHQYTLGFVPTKRDGRVGTIDVRVTRPGMTVWARKTYVAPTARQAPAAPLHTVDAAEAEGAAHPRVDSSERSGPSDAGEAAIRATLASARGTAERRCVETNGHPSVRSGDFVAGRFDVRAMAIPERPGDAPTRKLWWTPAHMPSNTPLRIRAGKLGAPGVVATLEFAGSDTRATGWPTGILLPEPGRWLLVVTAGSNWGCFVYDEA